MNMRKLMLIGLMVGLMAFSAIARANAFLASEMNYVDSGTPGAYFNLSSPSMCAVGGPYATIPFSYYWYKTTAIYAEFPTAIAGNGLYPNATISDAELCFKFKSVSSYSWSSYGYTKAFEIYPNVTDFGTDWTSGQTYLTQVCGPGITNGSYCNTTAYSSKTVVAPNMIGGNTVCFNVTGIAQRGINETGYVRVALNNTYGNYQYAVGSAFNCPFDTTAGWEAPYLKVTCGSTYEDFYNDTACQTVALYTNITTTTVNSSASYTFDYLNSTTSWVGQAIGSDSEGGKFLIWLAVSLVVSMLPMVYKLTKDIKFSIVVLMAMILLGVVVGWVPTWVGVAFIVASALIIAKVATNAFS